MYLCVSPWVVIFVHEFLRKLAREGKQATRVLLHQHIHVPIDHLK